MNSSRSTPPYMTLACSLETKQAFALVTLAQSPSASYSLETKEAFALVTLAQSPSASYSLETKEAFALVSLAQSLKAIYGGVGFPIRTSPDQCSFASSPELFAGCHVLHRL